MINTVRPATEADVHWLAPRLRPIDVLELKYASGEEPVDALMCGLKWGPAWIGGVDGVPIGMFGVVPDPIFDDAGIPWLLATPEIANHAMSFLRITRRAVQWFHNMGYALLHNNVWHQHQESIRWLEWAGFVPAREFYIGPERFITYAKMGEARDV